MIAARSATPSTVRANCSTTRIDTPLCGDLGDDLVELLDDQRGQAHRQLVEEQQRRVDGEAAGHRQHLLLAAGHRAGQLVAALPEAGEAGEGLLLDLASA